MHNYPTFFAYFLLGLIRLLFVLLQAATYCNAFALTICEKSNFWAEQAEAYAQCIVTAGLAGMHTVARQYVDLGKKLAQDKLDVSSSVLQMAGVYYLGCGDWKHSETSLKESIGM